MHRELHPLHALLLSSTLPLFLGVFLADLAYFKTFEIQWKNFASWLIVGALVFAGLTLLWALIALMRARWRSRANVVYLVLLLAIFVIGLINAFIHAGDAWASMPEGLVLSIVDVVLVLAAAWIGLFAARRVGRGAA